MNYLVQRGKVRGQVINVPEGLPELLSDITREVLRCQPTTECLCQFIIDYLHSMLEAREKARVAKGIIDRALRTVDEIIADLCICDIDQAKADKMAAAMEECFKRFLDRRRCEDNKEKEIIKYQEWDMLDELIERCKFTENELKKTRPVIEEAYNRFVDTYLTASMGAEASDALFQYFKERERRRTEEMRQYWAATRIQSIFRGYLVRRSMFVERKTDERIGSSVRTDSFTLEEQEEAATKIQRFYRRQRSKAGSQFIEQAAEVCEPASQVSMEAGKVYDRTDTAPVKVPKAAPVVDAPGEVTEKEFSMPPSEGRGSELSEPSAVPSTAAPDEPTEPLRIIEVSQDDAEPPSTQKSSGTEVTDAALRSDTEEPTAAASGATEPTEPEAEPIVEEPPATD